MDLALEMGATIDSANIEEVNHVAARWQEILKRILD